LNVQVRGAIREPQNDLRPSSEIGSATAGPGERLQRLAFLAVSTIVVSGDCGMRHYTHITTD
jgi:hypothetical protein